jgi:hypothetical protein
MKLTRREAAALLGAPAVPALPQASAAPAETPEQLLAAARNRLRRNLETLAKTRLPIATEPAFQFRAS